MGIKVVIRQSEGYSVHHKIDPYFIGYATRRLNERGNHDPPVVLGSRCLDVLKGSLGATCSLNTCLNLTFGYLLLFPFCSCLLVSAKVPYLQSNGWPKCE